MSRELERVNAGLTSIEKGVVQTVLRTTNAVVRVSASLPKNPRGMESSKTKCHVGSQCVQHSKYVARSF